MRVIGPARFIKKLPNFAKKQFMQRYPPKRQSTISVFNSTSAEHISPIIGNWFNGLIDNPQNSFFLGEKDKQEIFFEAELAKQKKFQINGKNLNLNSVKIGSRWDLDPESYVRWSNSSIFMPLDHSPGDVRYVWELGRLHHLATFGQAWHLSKDYTWCQTGLDHLKELFTDQDYLCGIHWRDGLQLAVRIFSILAFAELCADAPRKFHFEIKRWIKLHAYALQKQISPECELTNNHSIGETCALIVSGLYLDNHFLIKSGSKRLKKELVRQIYSDGVPYEGSLPYARFILDFLLLTISAWSSVSKNVPDWLIDKAADVLRVIHGLSDENGMLPPVGDGDDARVIKFDKTSYLDCSDTINFGINLLVLPLNYKGTPGGLGKWMLSNSDFVSPQKDPALRYSEFSNILHLAGSRFDLWIENSPTGFGENGPGGHGHNDVSSVIVHSYGKAVLHDPGWYTYYKDKEKRDFFRSTSQHNTIMIDGEEQARLGGMFEILDDCKPSKILVIKDKSLIIFRFGHSGYDRLQKGIKYHRDVIVDEKTPNEILIVDFVESKKSCKVTAHLGSALTWERENKHCFSSDFALLKFCAEIERISLCSSLRSPKTGVLDRGYSFDWEIPELCVTEGFIYESRVKLTIKSPN
ncbi:heparinase II/III-family protein [bacterium]|nr:heparinase II/III-family protein [bacterium]